MAILANGLETCPQSATAWRIVFNNNLLLLYTKTEVNNAIDAFKDVPSNVQSAAYTLALTDRGKSIDTTAGVTIPLNSAVAFPIGSVVSITNTSIASITITATTNVTLRLAGTTTVGNRTLALFGVATMRKIATDTWVISGAGVS